MAAEMKRLFKCLGVFSLVGIIAACSKVALASMLLLGVGGGGVVFNGPGSPGFLSATTAQFSVQNDIEYSNTFSSWTQSVSSGKTVTIGSTSVLAPDGTNTATAVTFSAVSGASAYAVLKPTLPVLPNDNYPYAFGVWAQVASSGSCGSAWATLSYSTTFVRAAIPNDGAWHLVSVNAPGGTFTSIQGAQIGVNLFDGGQSATTCPITINLWNSTFVRSDEAPIAQITAAQITASLQTTTAAATATLAVPLPTMSNGTQIAFRDFSTLTPYSGNPIITQNASEAYQAGGVSNPMVNAPLYSGGYYWGFANATDTYNHGDWLSFALYKSTDLIHWTEDTTNAPYMQAYGSNFTGTQGTGTISHYQLHPAWLPYGCNIGGTAHDFCVLFGADNNSSVAPQVYLAWSDTIDGVYTLYGCTSGPCAAPTPVVASPYLGSLTGNMLPAVVNVGGINGTNYIYWGPGGNVATYSLVASTPANPATTGAGTALTFDGVGIVRGPGWDASAYTIDNQVIANGCGFYEYFYTAYQTNIGGTGIDQVIGYEVSNSPTGPWWKYSTYVIPGTSSLYGGTSSIGDSAPMSLNGTLTWLGNFDNATNTSSAVAATMTDTCRQ